MNKESDIFISNEYVEEVLHALLEIRGCREEFELALQQQDLDIVQALYVVFGRYQWIPRFDDKLNISNLLLKTNYIDDYDILILTNIAPFVRNGSFFYIQDKYDGRYTYLEYNNGSLTKRTA